MANEEKEWKEVDDPWWPTTLKDIYNTGIYKEKKIPLESAEKWFIRTMVQYVKPKTNIPYDPTTTKRTHASLQEKESMAYALKKASELTGITPDNIVSELVHPDRSSAFTMALKHHYDQSEYQESHKIPCVSQTTFDFPYE